MRVLRIGAGVEQARPARLLPMEVLVLRGHRGTKFGCGTALCGACTVHIDGVATPSCVTPIDGIGASETTTIEAIGATTAGARIQKA